LVEETPSSTLNEQNVAKDCRNQGSHCNDQGSLVILASLLLSHLVGRLLRYPEQLVRD
jgi:hypothetical protein